MTRAMWVAAARQAEPCSPRSACDLGLAAVLIAECFEFERRPIVETRLNYGSVDPVAFKNDLDKFTDP